MNLTPILPALILFSLPVSAISDGEDEEIERISITAQKRQQTIQEVPVAVTSLWQEDTVKLRAQDAFDISFHTPGFSAGQFNLGQPQFFIRGIGSNEDGAGGDNAVVVNVDGVPVGRAAGSLFDFADLERIEVLRGPQGTLYGRNAIGGAINLISKRPNDEPSKRLQIGLGDKGLIDAKGFINTPLIAGQDVFASLSFNHRQRDGLVRSLYGPSQSDIKDSGIKGQVYSEVSDTFNWRLIGEYSWVRRQGPGRHAIGGAIEPLVAAYDASIVDDPFINLSPYEGYQDRDTLGLTLILDNTLEWARLDSVTGFRRTDIASAIDQFGISAQEGLLANVFGFGLAGTNDVDEASWQFSQEFRLSHQSDTWFWLMGLFYFHEDVERTESFNYPPTSLSFQQNQTESLALFGEASYEFNNLWSVTAGGRLSWEQKEVEQAGKAGLLIISEDYDINAKESWQKFTPRIALNFAPTTSVNTYFSLSTGFKSGGFQGQAPTALAASRPFDEENALAYELGLKWQSPDTKSRLLIALFHMAYDDLQVLQLVDDPTDPNDVGVLVTENAADATSRGVELEYKWQLNESWGLSGHYAYLDATYDAFISAQGDFSGNRLRNAPEHAASLALDFTTHLTSGADLNLTYSHSYKDTRFQDPANIENTAIPSHHVGNLNVDYHAANANWLLGFWIDNVWDQTYYVHGFPILGSGIMTVAPDRNAGIRLLIEF